MRALISTTISITWLTLIAVVLSGCQVGPPARLEAYLGPLPAKAPTEVPAEPVKAGLLVINDTTAKGSAPALSEDALNGLAKVLRHRLEKDVPIKVVNAQRGDGMMPNHDPTQFVQLAEKEAVGYFVLAIFSSSETEWPVYLGLNGVFHASGADSNNPGVQTRNFALVELALLNGKTGQTILHADGLSFASLYTLNVPVKSNVYPVVFRRGLQNPIYPQSDETAHDTLRAVSSDEAINQAVMHYRMTWNKTITKEAGTKEAGKEAGTTD